VGVDVWGRNQYGDGGFGTYRALTQIAPEGLGLSVALFGQGWTWETTEGKPDWTWHNWWKYDRKLWLGPEDPKEIVPVPPMSEMSSKKQALNPEVSLPGPFTPIVSYFKNLSPPNPLDLPFVTFFSPGIGFKWFVKGKEIMDTRERGWTDVQKQTSLGNLIWPRPTPLWEEGGGRGEMPLGSTSLDFTDAWLGGSSLKVTLRFSGDEEAYFRHLWLPLQSISVYRSQSYDVSLIYKTDAPGLDLETTLTVGSPREFEFAEVTTVELENGWTKLHVHFMLPTDRVTATEVRSVVGIVLGFATEDPSQPCELPINIGMLSVYPSPPRPPSKLVHHKPKVLWANYLGNLLTWEIAAYFNPIPDGTMEPQPPDNTDLKWEMSPADTAYPKFMFFNIYVEVKSTVGFYRGPEHATFIGTTGWDGRDNRFYVEDAMLPKGSRTGSGVDVRFYVQGVTNRGEILSWIDGVFVEAKL
jgi:mannosyl-glycoprotein endo-beta-N-acetylglucosaminidase